MNYNNNILRYELVEQLKDFESEEQKFGCSLSVIMKALKDDGIRTENGCILGLSLKYKNGFYIIEAKECITNSQISPSNTFVKVVDYRDKWLEFEEGKNWWDYEK